MNKEEVRIVRTKRDISFQTSIAREEDASRSSTGKKVLHMLESHRQEKGKTTLGLWLHANKAPKNRIESGKTIPHLGSQQKEHEPLRVLMEKEQHVMEFMWET